MAVRSYIITRPMNPHKLSIIFQNSKEVKQIRQFIKCLHYVYDCITNKKQKKVFLYVCKDYIALVNDYMENNVPEYRVALCVLRKNMFRFANNKHSFQGNEGIIYRVESQNLIKTLNSHVEPDITQFEMLLPTDLARQENQGLMLYTGEGFSGERKFYLQIEQHSEWPFIGGKMVDKSPLFQKAEAKNFINVIPKFVKSIEYIKSYGSVWLYLSTDGVTIKRTDGDRTVLEHIIRTKDTLEYNASEMDEYLLGNSYLNLNTSPVFHHLETSNRQGKKCCCKLLAIRGALSTFENPFIEKCFLLMETVTEKREIYEAIQIEPRQVIDYRERTVQVNHQRPRLLTREPKKEEILETEERVILNRFYNHQQEQEYMIEMSKRETIKAQEVQKMKQEKSLAPRFKMESK